MSWFPTQMFIVYCFCVCVYSLLCVVWYGMCVPVFVCARVCRVCDDVCARKYKSVFVFLFFCFFCFFVCLFLLILLDDAMKFSVFGDDGQAVKIDDNVKRWSVCFK